VGKIFKNSSAMHHMEKRFLPLVVFWLALALCIAVLAMNSEVAQKTHSDIKETENVETEIIPIGDVTDIVSIKTHVVVRDWDADGKNDGLVLYITFYDEHGSTVEFTDTEYTVRIKIFGANVDSHSTIVRGELLYDFCCPPVRKRSSHEVGALGGGIEMYVDLPTEWVIIEVEVEIPGVRTFSAEETVPLSP
jgi:hypothetical protein